MISYCFYTTELIKTGEIVFQMILEPIGNPLSLRFKHVAIGSNLSLALTLMAGAADNASVKQIIHMSSAS